MWGGTRPEKEAQTGVCRGQGQSLGTRGSRVRVLGIAVTFGYHESSPGQGRQGLRDFLPCPWGRPEGMDVSVEHPVLVHTSAEVSAASPPSLPDPTELRGVLMAPELYAAAARSVGWEVAVVLAI